MFQLLQSTTHHRYLLFAKGLGLQRALGWRDRLHETETPSCIPPFPRLFRYGDAAIPFTMPQIEAAVLRDDSISATSLEWRDDATC